MKAKKTQAAAPVTGKRTKRKEVLFSDADWANIQTAAQARGWNTSHYIWRMAIMAAEQDVQTLRQYPGSLKPRQGE